MQEIEFAVDNTALAAVRDIVINANFEEVEAALKEMTAPYTTMIVTEDDISGAKSDRAKLRKVRTSIDEYRKSIGKAYKTPVEAFNNRVKPLLEICDAGIENLDVQIKNIEAARKLAKVEGLITYFDVNAGEAAEFINFEQIFNPKWENSGFSVEEAQAEIDAAISSTINSVMAIRATQSEFVPALLQEYARCRDLASVLRMNQQLTERKAAEERRKAEEAARRKTEAQAKADTAKYAAAPEETDESLLTVDFRVYATKEQLNALKAFLKNSGIRYGRVQ